MKKIIILTVFTAAVFSSCKKKDSVSDSPAAGNEKRVSKIESNGNFAYGFTYNTSGQLLTFTNSSGQRFEYDYSNNSLTYKMYNSANQLSQELKNVICLGNLLKSVLYQNYNGAGELGSAWVISFEQNADGTLKSFDDGDLHLYEYTDGNYTKTTRLKNGVLYESSQYDYYTDKENKFNIPYLEYLYEFPLMHNYVGKSNRNLMKKVVTVRAGNTYTYNFTYEFDSGGYVTKIYFQYQKNSDTPVNNVVSITY